MKTEKNFAVYEILQKIRSQKPVVHHLTNWVTIYDCASIVKIIGGSPVMAHAPEEVEEMVNIASSLVLNIGTLTTDFVEAMKIAVRAANIRKIPVVLDVCGAGATKLRDRKAFELIEYSHIDIIKGNASEVARVAGEDVRTKGVDAGDVRKDILAIAETPAKNKGCTVVATGKEDIVSDGNSTYIVRNGVEMLAHVVGTGCITTSLVGTFVAVEKDYAFASMSALACFGIASEIALGNCTGPASFKEKLFDVLYNLDEKKINELIKVERTK